jgi:hypothetical protein
MSATVTVGTSPASARQTLSRSDASVASVAHPRASVPLHEGRMHEDAHDAGISCWSALPSNESDASAPKIACSLVGAAGAAGT